NSLALTHLDHLPRFTGDNSANPYPVSNDSVNQRLAFPDLVVGLGTGSVSSLVTMTGFGDGTFINPVTYSGRPDVFVSPASVVPPSDRLVNLTTFQSGGAAGGSTGRSANVNLVANGNFELRDLTNQRNSLSGWQTFDQQNSRGSFNTATGLRSDQSSE